MSRFLLFVLRALSKTILGVAVVALLVVPSTRVFGQVNEFFARFEERTVQHEGKEFPAFIDRKTGLIHRLRGLKDLNLNIGASIAHVAQRDQIESTARHFLSRNPELLGIPVEELGEAHIDSGNDLWAISFRQAYKGVPVNGTEIGFTVNRKGRIIAFGVDAYPDLTLSTIPLIDATAALHIAEETYAQGELVVKEAPALSIRPTEQGEGISFALVWTFVAEVQGRDGTKTLAFVLDAHTGQLQEVYEAGRSFGDVQAAYAKHPEEKPQPAGNPFYTISGDITFQYYTNPNQLVGETSFPKGAVTISLPGSPYIQSFNADGNGHYTFSPPSGGIYSVRFKTATPYASASTNESYSVTVPPNQTVDQYWYSGTPNSNDPQSRANAVYLMTDMHDYFEAYPFDVSYMDYQMTLINLTQNATHAEALGTSLNIGATAAKSADVVYHEYTHNVIYKLYDNSFIEPNTSNNDTEASAMDEGFADYFSSAKQNDPSQGEGHSAWFNRNMVNSYTMDDWSDWDSHPRKAQMRGQIIAGTVWGLKSNQYLWWAWGQPSDFKRKVDSNCYWALWLSPHPDTFYDYYLNFLDVDMYGGAGASVIEAAFGERGIIPGYSKAPSQATAGASTASPQPAFTVYPNPSNPEATVRFHLDEAQPVRLAVYDVRGRELTVLVDENREAGWHTLLFDGAGLPSGVYLLRLEARSGFQTQQVVLQK